MLPEYKQYIDENGNVTFPPEVTQIEHKAFGFCNRVQCVFIPSTVTYIGSFAFFHCHRLHTVIIEAKIKILRISTFAYCDSLSFITFPDTLIYICSGAFMSNGLSSINLPLTLENIGEQAFAWNFNLIRVTLKQTNAQIGPEAFNNCNNLQLLDICANVTLYNRITTFFPRVTIVRSPDVNVDKIATETHNLHCLVSPSPPTCPSARERWLPLNDKNIATAMRHLYAMRGKIRKDDKPRVKNMFMCLNRCKLPNEIVTLIYEYLPWNDTSIVGDRRDIISMIDLL